MRKTGWFLMMLAVVACGGKPAKKTAVPRPANAVKAPPFTLSDTRGNWVSLHDLEGKVVLLNFWGTWCAPCRREIPDFIKVYDQLKDQGLEIVGIAISSGSPSDIAAFMKSRGMNYLVLTDIDGQETQMVAQHYGEATGEPINGIPTTFIIDREGYIVKRYLGPQTEATLLQDIKPYL
ncbi:MAG: TlpA family protein disulfide reductase [Candidatus Neomarinimicrobiota bacterium]|nr:MAG: TlpA family protein disulfide reductase [Candidatus Neomarinimicrobiota bacterium]